MIRKDMDVDERVIDNRLLNDAIENGRINPKFSKYPEAMALAENEIDESPRRADRRERLRAHRAPDDDRVRERVKKLKQIAADNRQRKGEDRPRRTPRRQILNHSDAPPKFPARRANAARFRERIF